MFMFLGVLQTRLCLVAAMASAATISTIRPFINSLYCHLLLALFAMNCKELYSRPMFGKILLTSWFYICWK